MGIADEQIRVNATVKRKIELRRRGGESYNDVLERMFSTDRDLLAGFGRWSDEEAERVRESRRKSKDERKRRMRKRIEDTA